MFYCYSTVALASMREEVPNSYKYIKLWKEFSEHNLWHEQTTLDHWFCELTSAKTLAPITHNGSDLGSQDELIQSQSPVSLRSVGFSFPHSIVSPVKDCTTLWIKLNGKLTMHLWLCRVFSERGLGLRSGWLYWWFKTLFSPRGLHFCTFGETHLEGRKRALKISQLKITWMKLSVSENTII